jgi:hypothetical protein
VAGDHHDRDARIETPRHRDVSGVLERVPRQFVHSDTILSTLAGLLGAPAS